MKKQSAHTKALPNAWYFEQVMDTLAQGKKVKIPVVGDSMRPFLANGDLVVLRALMERKLKQGTIVLAYYNEKYILHRVLCRKGDRIRLVGDGNLDQIEELSVTDVRAVACSASRDAHTWACNTAIRRWLGITWFVLRPLRKVGNKILKIIT